MNTPRSVAATIALLLIPLSAAFAGLGGPKCPPRRGLITLAPPSAIGTSNPFDAKAKEARLVVFVDEADHRVYQMNIPKTAQAHVGHHVTLVAHPETRHPNILFVHEIRCSDHR